MNVRPSCYGYFLLLVLPAVVGCGEYQTRTLEDIAASEKLNRFERDKFILAMEIPTRRDTVERYLAWDIRSENILPIRIFLENRNEEFNFEIRTRDSRFRLADGTQFEILSLEAVLDELGASDEMIEDYRSKALSDRNLPPMTGGRSSRAQGYLFFKPPEGRLRDRDLSGSQLSLEVTKRGPEGGDTFTAVIIKT